MTLYKYINYKWVPELLTNGTIHIETLESLKKIEGTNKAIGDKEEGHLSSIMDGHTINPNDPSTISPQLSRVLTSGNLRFQDPQTIRRSFNEDTANCYIFSTSISLKREIMTKLNKDSCLIIKNAELFFERLTAYMQKRLPLAGFSINKVVYTKKTQHHSTQTSARPIFTKDLSFAVEDEYRIIWSARTPSKIVPENISCLDITPFFSIAKI